MCYLIYFSTSSDEDFTMLQSEHFTISTPDPVKDSEYTGLPEHAHCWFLMCKYGGCSCHFRHFLDDKQFAPIAEWRQEDEDDVESTIQIYDVFWRLFLEGHHLDIVDVWSGTPPEEVDSIDVDLSEVFRENFRIFENRRFAVI